MPHTSPTPTAGSIVGIQSPSRLPIPRSNVRSPLKARRRTITSTEIHRKAGHIRRASLPKSPKSILRDNSLNTRYVFPLPDGTSLPIVSPLEATCNARPTIAGNNTRDSSSVANSASVVIPSTALQGNIPSLLSPTASFLVAKNTSLNAGASRCSSTLSLGSRFVSGSARSSLLLTTSSFMALQNSTSRISVVSPPALSEIRTLSNNQASKTDVGTVDGLSDLTNAVIHEESEDNTVKRALKEAEGQDIAAVKTAFPSDVLEIIGELEKVATQVRDMPVPTQVTTSPPQAVCSQFPKPPPEPVRSEKVLVPMPAGKLKRSEHSLFFRTARAITPRKLASADPQTAATLSSKLPKLRRMTFGRAVSVPLAGPSDKAIPETPRKSTRIVSDQTPVRTASEIARPQEPASEQHSRLPQPRSASCPRRSEPLAATLVSVVSKKPRQGRRSEPRSAWFD